MLDVGDQIHLTALFKDATGTLVDPTTVALTITLPDQTTTGPTPVKDSTGTYHYDYLTTQYGRHTARWLGTGTNPGVLVQTFNVGDTTGRSIISLDEAKQYLGLSGTTYDDELRGFVSGVTEVVEMITGPVLPQTVDEWYDGGYSQIVLTSNPLLSVTSVVETYGSTTTRTLTNQPLDGGSIDAYGYTVDLESGTVTRRISGLAAPFALGRRNIHIVYVAGRAVVPYSIQQGVRDLIRVNWQPRISGSRPSFQGASAGGVDTTAEPGSWTLGYFVPNRVAQQLLPSIHSWGIA